jgi:protein involved in polysaccharide export with SLBB domain
MVAAACEPTLKPRPEVFPNLSGGQIAPHPYVLQVGDQLAIKFYTNPELNEEVVIRPDGMISLQLIDDVQAAGLSPAQLDAELTQRYTSELATPEVSVIVADNGGQRVYVAGEVAEPGEIKLAGGLTVGQAIEAAGGFLTTAHRRHVVIIRRGPDGKPVGQQLDLRPVFEGTDPEVDVPLQPYDIVHVPRSLIANLDLWVEQYIRDLLPVQPILPAF